MGDFLGDKKVQNLSAVETKLRDVLADLQTLSLQKAVEEVPGKTFIGSEYNKLNGTKVKKEQIRSMIANKFSKKYPLA
jgi:Tfp pilus assembly PilM family ATPase